MSDGLNVNKPLHYLSRSNELTHNQSTLTLLPPGTVILLPRHLPPNWPPKPEPVKKKKVVHFSESTMYPGIPSADMYQSLYNDNNSGLATGASTGVSAQSPVYQPWQMPAMGQAQPLPQSPNQPMGQPLAQPLAQPTNFMPMAQPMVQPMTQSMAQPAPPLSGSTKVESSMATRNSFSLPANTTITVDPTGKNVTIRTPNGQVTYRSVDSIMLSLARFSSNSM